MVLHGARWLKLRNKDIPLLSTTMRIGSVSYIGHKENLQVKWPESPNVALPQFSIGWKGLIFHVVPMLRLIVKDMLIMFAIENEPGSMRCTGKEARAPVRWP